MAKTLPKQYSFWLTENEKSRPEVKGFRTRKSLESSAPTWAPGLLSRQVRALDGLPEMLQEQRTSVSLRKASNYFAQAQYEPTQAVGYSWNTYYDVHPISSRQRQNPDYKAQLEELRRLLEDQRTREYGYGVFHIDGDIEDRPLKTSNELGEIGI